MKTDYGHLEAKSKCKPSRPGGRNGEGQTPAWFHAASYDYLEEMPLDGWLWEFARRRWWDKAEASHGQPVLTGPLFEGGRGDLLLRLTVGMYWRRRWCDLPERTTKVTSSFALRAPIETIDNERRPKVLWGLIPVWVDLTQPDEVLEVAFRKWLAKARKTAEGGLDGSIAGCRTRARRREPYGTRDMSTWLCSQLLQTYDLCNGIGWDGDARMEQTRDLARKLGQGYAVKLLSRVDRPDQTASERMTVAKRLIQGDAFYALQAQLVMDAHIPELNRGSKTVR